MDLEGSATRAGHLAPQKKTFMGTPQPDIISPQPPNPNTTPQTPQLPPTASAPACAARSTQTARKDYNEPEKMLLQFWAQAHICTIHVDLAAILVDSSTNLLEARVRCGFFGLHSARQLECWDCYENGGLVGLRGKSLVKKRFICCTVPCICTTAILATWLLFRRRC